MSAATAANRGYCGVTDVGGDCSSSLMGAWELSAAEAQSWPAALDACRQRCLGCQQCRYVSVSKRYRDCSWFNGCEMDALYHRVEGFLTMAVKPTAAALTMGGSGELSAAAKDGGGIACAAIRRACFLPLPEGVWNCSSNVCRQRPFAIFAYGGRARDDVRAALAAAKPHVMDPVSDFGRLRHLEADVHAVDHSQPPMPLGAPLHMLWPRHSNGHGDVVRGTLLPLGWHLRTHAPPTHLALSGLRYPQVIAPLQNASSVCASEHTRLAGGEPLPRCRAGCHEAIHLCWVPREFTHGSRLCASCAARTCTSPCTAGASSTGCTCARAQS